MSEASIFLLHRGGNVSLVRTSDNIGREYKLLLEIENWTSKTISDCNFNFPPHFLVPCVSIVA